MPHNPRHGADPRVIIGGGSGFSAPPSPPKPNNPMDFFGSMYTSPGSSSMDMGSSGTSEEADKNIDRILGGDSSSDGQGTGNQDTSGSKTDDDTQTLTEKVEDTATKIIDLFTGDEIKQLDKLQLQAAQNLLNQYQKLGINNPLKLRALMTSNIFGGIFGKDQTVSDMEGNIVDPKNAFDDTGNLKEGFRFTKEGIIGQLENIDPESNIMESLKKFNPELYYPLQGMPATSGGLVDLANIQVTEEMQGANPELAKMIFDARMELDRMGKDRSGNTQGGGQGGGGGTYIPPVTPPVDPTNPIPPQQPTLPPGITPPLNPSTRFPDSVIRDYTQLGLPQIYSNQQMPNYATFNRAGPMPVGLQNYLDALRNRFGIG